MPNSPLKHFTYNAADSKACCSRIEVALRGDVIEGVEIVDGCEGNHRGLQALVKGRQVREVIALLRHTPCGDRGTSCPDQLAKALAAAMKT